MITLVSDNALLTVRDYSKPTDEQSVLRFLYQAVARQDQVYSHWQLLKEASQEVAGIVARALTGQDNWASVGLQTKSEFLRMRRREFSKYPLPEEVFARTQAIFDRLISVHRDLENALMDQTGAERFCELWPDPQPNNAGITYVYRNKTLWSSRRTLMRNQWIALIDRALAEDERVLAALTQTGSGVPDIINKGFISVEVRREVWRRDQGKCLTCGSQLRLEFDHIIPVAMGGASTARNVQLLCESCNRTKAATLG